MTEIIQERLRRFAWRFIVQQAVLVLALIIGFALLGGARAALSSFYAGLICVICNGYFALRVFSQTGASQSRQILNGFYWGEAVKLVFAAILFAIVMKYGNIHPVAFFVTLIIVQLGYFMSLLLQKSPTKGQ